jgi:hypothetical protein
MTGESAAGTVVWIGRALQAECDDLKMLRLSDIKMMFREMRER